MYVPTSPSTPLGPMTRPRAKAIKDKVNSLLSEQPLSTHETWLLLQTETLCVIRYLEEGHRAATSNGQDGEDTKYEAQEEELPLKLQPRDDRSELDVRHLKPSLPKSQPMHATASGCPDRTGRPASPPREWMSGLHRTTDTITTEGKLAEVRSDRTSGTTITEQKQQKSDDYRTSGRP